MKKVLSIFIIALVFSYVAKAQVNLNVGGFYSPNTTIKIDKSDKTGNLATLSYKPTYGGSASIDFGGSFLHNMLEISYYTGEMTNIEQSDPILFNWNASDLRTLKSIAVFYSSGKNLLGFLSSSRLQLPAHIGVGFTHNDIGPAKNNLFTVGVKARLKFYITDKIAIYAGGGYRGAIPGNFNPKVADISVGQSILYADAGLSFSLVE